MATAYVYTPTGWVEKQTKVGPTNMNKIEAGVQQGAHITGLESDRTTALAAANPGALMYCTDSAITYQSLGSGWQLIHAQPVVVSALPANAVEGQRIRYYPDATNNPGAAWDFVYVSADTTGYPWYAVGAQAVYSEQAASWNPGAGTSTWRQSTPAGPSFTVPWDGWYELSYEGNFGNSGTNTAEAINVGIKLGQHLSVPGSDLMLNFNHPGSTSSWGYNSRRVVRRKLTNTSLTGLTLAEFGQSVNGADTITNRILGVKPINV